MSKFTLEQIHMLRENPYVMSVYTSRIKFTADFKREYMTRFDAGETGRDILRSFGIDPDIMGDSRIWSLQGKFRDELERHGCFSDVRRKKENDVQSASIEQLRIEVAYVKQEVEFLKKNLTLDLEAQRKGSRKVARMQSLNSSET